MANFKIIGNTIGNDAGPFTIKTNAGVTLATGVTRLQILAGYTVNVPTGATDLVVTSDPANTTCVTNQTFPIPNEGFWEMEKSGVETISDHYGAIQANYVSPVETFVADDVVGIYTGVVGTGGTWLIKAGPEDIAGTTYNGGGTLIVTNANTPGSTTIQTGAIVQLGRDLDALTGSIAANLTTVQAGAVLNVVGANEVAFSKTQALTNAGMVNWTGPDACGEGWMQANGAVTNTGIINIDNAVFQSTGGFTGVTGTVNVLDGGTLGSYNLTMPATQTVNTNGCGWCGATGVQEGAIRFGASSTAGWNAITNVQTASCFKLGAGASVPFNGQLTGSAPLTISSLNATTPNGTTAFANTGNTYSGTMSVVGTTVTNANLPSATVDLGMNARFSIPGNSTQRVKSLSGSSPSAILSAPVPPGYLNILDNGSTTYAGVMRDIIIDLQGGSANTLRVTNSDTTQTGVNFQAVAGANLIMDGARWTGATSRANIAGGGYISAGSSTAASVYRLDISASTLKVEALSATSTNLLTADVFYSTGGYKVDVPAGLVAGTYPILKVLNVTGAGGTLLPTTGVNASGLTATYAWSATTPKTLLMTLA